MIQVVGEALGEIYARPREEIETTVAAKDLQANDPKLTAVMQTSFDELKQEIKKIRRRAHWGNFGYAKSDC
jgi:galactokinase